MPIKTEERRMISRYTRRPVSHSLEIRGLSRSSLDHHPLPEEVDDEYLPQHLLQDLQEAVSTYNSSETTSAGSGRSDCLTVTTGDTTRSWSGIHSYTGTGISTERSSVFSWGYDEFDKAASRQVQQMFEEIDEELYEGRGGEHLRGLQDECHQWAFRFPHLRILGSQLLCPSDEGFRWYSTSGKSPPAGSIDAAGQQDIRRCVPEDKDKIGPSTDLCVQGRKAVLSRSCVEADQADQAPGTPSGHDRSRVIESEGLVEEYLAFDSRDLDDELDLTGVGLGQRRCCLPPVSPYRCRRQAVLDLLFDDVWRELVGWMEELVRRHWEGCVSDEEKNAVNFSPSQSDAQNRFLLSALPTLLPRLGQSKVPQLTSLPAQSIRVPVGTPGTHHNLNDLIVIHGIPLQQRNLCVMERAQDPEERTAGHRPGSSVVLSKPRPRRVLEQSSSSLSRPPQSAQRRNLPPRTLLPLAPSLTQSSPAGSLDGGVRGTRLHTANERLASPPMPLSSHTLLPPISTGEAESTHSRLPFRPTQRHRGSSSRAHSAVTDEAGSLLPRDRLHQLDVFSRPNTTHTYRSDTPYRRSFTMLDSVGQGRPGRASVGTDSLGIGVTGISMGISSSSFLDSFTHHPLDHSPIEDEEEPDKLAPPPGHQEPPYYICWLCPWDGFVHNLQLSEEECHHLQAGCFSMVSCCLNPALLSFLPLPSQLFRCPCQSRYTLTTVGVSPAAVADLGCSSSTSPHSASSNQTGFGTAWVQCPAAAPRGALKQTFYKLTATFVQCTFWWYYLVLFVFLWPFFYMLELSACLAAKDSKLSPSPICM